jgi:hypothetical protein
MHMTLKLTATTTDGQTVAVPDDDSVGQLEDNGVSDLVLTFASETPPAGTIIAVVYDVP